MSLLNRFFALSPHLRLAIIMAPAMAVIGFLVSEYFLNPGEPQKPSYALSAGKDCNPLQSKCQLGYEGLRLSLRVSPAETGAGSRIADLESSQPLAGVTLEITGVGSRGPTRLMQVDDASHWRAKISAIPETPKQVRLAVATELALYFAELPLAKD